VSVLQGSRRGGNIFASSGVISGMPVKKKTDGEIDVVHANGLGTDFLRF